MPGLVALTRRVQALLAVYSTQITVEFSVQYDLRIPQLVFIIIVVIVFGSAIKSTHVKGFNLTFLLLQMNLLCAKFFPLIGTKIPFTIDHQLHV